MFPRQARLMADALVLKMDSCWTGWIITCTVSLRLNKSYHIVEFCVCELPWCSRGSLFILVLLFLLCTVTYEHVWSTARRVFIAVKELGVHPKVRRFNPGWSFIQKINGIHGKNLSERSFNAVADGHFRFNLGKSYLSIQFIKKANMFPLNVRQMF